MGAASWRPRMGDRVRVRAGVGTTIHCETMPQDAAEAGHTGVVYSDRSLDGAPDHLFLVSFDRPAPRMVVMDVDVSLPARHYAADELEPAE